MSRALISVTDLRGADLRGASFACPDCTIVSVTFSNLTGADLRRVDFGPSWIANASFEAADLRGANFADTIGLPWSLRDAVYDDDTRLPVGVDPETWEMVYQP